MFLRSRDSAIPGGRLREAASEVPFDGTKREYPPVRSRLAAIVYAAVALVVSRGVAAEPSAADLETARSLYREGKALRAAGNGRPAMPHAAIVVTK